MTLVEKGQQLIEPVAMAIGHVPVSQHIKGCLNGGKKASLCSFFLGIAWRDREEKTQCYRKVGIIETIPVT